MRFKQVYTILSFALLSSTLCVGAYAKVPPPVIVKIALPANTPKPPGNKFFNDEHMVPSLDALEAEASAQQASTTPIVAQSSQGPAQMTTDSSSATAPPVRAFRTLSEAAKAGVNPMPKLKPISLGKPMKPTPRTLWTRIHWFVYAGLALLVLLGIAYAVFSPRIRRGKA